MTRVVPGSRWPDEPPWPDELTTKPKPKPVPTAKRLATRTFADLIAGDPAPPPMLVAGLLPLEGSVVLAGPPKVGKSLLLSQVALAVAGRVGAVLGREALDGPALLVIEEGSSEGVSYRLRRQAEALGVGADVPLAVALRQRVRLDDPRSVAALRETVRATGARLVALDPLNRLHAADENRPTEMTRVMNVLADVAAEFRAVVVAAHHLSKPSPERRGSVFDRFRGAGAIRSATDANLVLDGSGEAVHLEGEFRDCEPLDLYLRLDRETLTFATTDAPRVAGKIDPAELRAFVAERGQVTAAAVMERFGVKSRNTALDYLERAGFDHYVGPNRTKFFVIGGSER